SSAGCWPSFLRVRLANVSSHESCERAGISHMMAICNPLPMWADRIRKATLCADAGHVTAVNLSHARIAPSITPFEISRAANDQYDVIFDLMGNYPLKAIRRVLRSKGTFVGCGG